MIIFYVQENDEAINHNTTRNIADLFSCGKRRFRNQEEVRKAYHKEYNMPISQSAVSKAIKKLKNGFKYSNSNNEYYIYGTGTNGSGYCCLNEYEIHDDKRFQIIELKLFKYETVWTLPGTPKAYIFWIKEKKKAIAEKSMADLLGPEALDIFCYQNKLVIVLKPGSKYDLKEFFNLGMKLG